MSTSNGRSDATPSLPPRPRLVLRAGFAGSQKLITDQEFASQPLPTDVAEREKALAARAQAVAEGERLVRALPVVLGTLGRQLAAIIPAVPVDQGSEPPVARYFEEKCPLLRLVTGLCQGADAIAGQMIFDAGILPEPDEGKARQPGTHCLETELAAVLPFDVETYRGSRPQAFRAEFDRQLSKCAWVLALDGIYEKPSPDTALAKDRRGRAYRAQSAFLLRHSDVLIAAANPDDTEKAGGTLETVREALAFELPVIFIHTGRDGDNVVLIGPDDDLHSMLAERTQSAAVWQEQLSVWVRQLTADPDSGLNPAGGAHDSAHSHGEQLLAEYFREQACPPRDDEGRRRATCRERVWNWFEKRFRVNISFRPDTPLEPFAQFRTRATDLNHHYSGLYRGAFLLNYGLAILAVLAAAVSLTLLGTAGHTAVGEQTASVLRAAGHLPEQDAVSPSPKAWLPPTLLVLALVKLALLRGILKNTRRANKERWNDRAVDYRYLAERLRGMFYLPLAGSHQPPAAEPPQFASRAVRQSPVDWLFDSIVRAISPADLPHAQAADFPGHDGRGRVGVRKLLTLDPQTLVEKVRDAWVAEQARYHERNSRTMQAMHHVIEWVAVFLGWAVVAVVALDVVLIGGKAFHLLPDSWIPSARKSTPWLIFVSTILPAMVAAMGGVRFQSECQRLAERSAVMRVILAGRSSVRPASSRKGRWARVVAWLRRAFQITRLVLRRLFGCSSPPLAVQINGGRWKLADDLAHRIAAAKTAAAQGTDPGSWNHDALRLTERVADAFVQEAAEWSVLYTKEVSHPG